MSDKINRRAFLGMGYGMYIVSASNDGKANGQIANTVFQVTNNPPQVAAAISKSNLTHEFIQKAGHFSVSILHEETPMIFLGTFGFRSGRVIDKFENTGHTIGETGAPIVTENCMGNIETKVINQVDAGTHTLFIGEVIKAEILNDKPAMTYKFYRENIKGKTPVDSPTYIAED